MSDMLDLMKRDDLTPEQEAAYNAATGQNMLPVEEFKGKWRVSMEDRVEFKLDRAGKSKEYKAKIERGMKDVVLTMPLPDKEEFSNLIINIRRRFGYESTPEAVLDALRFFAERAEPAG